MRKAKKVENSEQPQKEVKDLPNDVILEEIFPTGGFELLERKETYMVEVWKDGKRDRTIGVIDIWYNTDEENAE